jgi:orotidine-5'-phosphate decarboxylase
MKNLDRIILALDQMNADEIKHFLDLHGHHFKTIKIGLELYLKYGNQFILEMSQKYQKDIFLDLKLHDIPKTVEKAIRSLENLPIKFLTVHLGGGLSMLESSLNEIKKTNPTCKLLGVSFLTSLELKDLQMIYGIQNSDEAFLRLFKLAHDSGISGVVCSAHELHLLKSLQTKLIAVTPGVRFLDEINNQSLQDQKRVMDPLLAIKKGADYLVMGRSFTQSNNIKIETRIAQLI